MKNVTNNTRAGKNGKVIVCPKCNEGNTVYHFAWLSRSCPACREISTKADYLLLEHEDISRRGGSAKTPKKMAACRKNARKPRKKKMPEYDTVTLLKLAHLELVASYGVIGGDEIKRDGLHINGIPFVDVINHHLEKL